MRWLLRLLFGERLRVDQWRIHKLEYDLGIRDDPPPSRTSPQTCANFAAVLKDAYGN